MLAFGWAGKKAGDGAPGRAGDEPGELTPAGPRRQAAGMPAGGGGELPANGSVDWAKPQASEPAEDWDRLSLSVSGTGSWNAFAAAAPAKQEQKPEEAAEEKAAEPATDQRQRPGGGGGDDGAGEPPGSPAGGKAEPALAAGPAAAAAKPNGRNGRGRNKAKQPAPGPSARPAPTDAADEWISLLTADSVEELSAPGADRPRSTPGPRLSSPAHPAPDCSAPGCPAQAARPGGDPARDTPWPG